MKLMNLESMYHDFLRQFQAKERSNDNLPTNCELIGAPSHTSRCPKGGDPVGVLISGVIFFFGVFFFGVDTVFFFCGGRFDSGSWVMSFFFRFYLVVSVISMVFRSIKTVKGTW